MRKLLLLIGLAVSALLLTQCRSGRAAKTQRHLNYVSDIQPLVANKCTPCHIPDKGGKVEALNTYTSVKSHIDDIIRRIELNPGEKGYMPFKKPKLSDSAINVFKQWKTDGMLENAD
ncbi:MAG: hypothetical protein K0Q66_1194 [Chitinophagaceae bacterium]|jgi:hypothetical protein|nr:hypothetical protein [Chitinophagaceae bacterium]